MDFKVISTAFQWLIGYPLDIILWGWLKDGCPLISAAETERRKLTSAVGEQLQGGNSNRSQHVGWGKLNFYDLLSFYFGGHIESKSETLGYPFVVYNEALRNELSSSNKHQGYMPHFHMKESNP